MAVAAESPIMHLSLPNKYSVFSVLTVNAPTRDCLLVRLLFKYLRYLATASFHSVAPPWGLLAGSSGIRLSLFLSLSLSLPPASPPAAMSGFNLLHLITKSQPVALRPCGLRSGTCRTKKTWPVSFSQEDLRKRLTPMQFHVTQEKGTESAFRGELTDHKDEGTYTCVVCGTPLFKSDTKFDSGSGWPSFSDLMKEESVTVTDDFSYGMHRVETTCSQCGAHLGHLFDDGPRPTGKRYCINSASLAFQPKDSSPPTDVEGAGAAEGSATGGKTEL